MNDTTAARYGGSLVLQISDPHLFATTQPELRGVNSNERFLRVLDAARSAYPQADALLLSGDIAQDEERATYTRLRALLEPLGMPVLTLPGNHDNPPAMAQVLRGGRFHYCEPVSLDNWCIVTLDSHVEGQTAGKLDSHQLQRLNDAARDAEHVLVALHHQPLASGCAWLDRIGLLNADEFRRAIDASDKIRGVFWGHVHQEAIWQIGPVIYASTPSTGVQFMPNSTEFAVDTRPGAYRAIQLFADGQIRTAVHWVD